MRYWYQQPPANLSDSVRTILVADMLADAREHRAPRAEHERRYAALLHEAFAPRLAEEGQMRIYERVLHRMIGLDDGQPRRHLDGKADPCEQRDDRSCKGHHRAQHEPELRQGDLRLELVVRDEERQRGAEQAEKEDLSPEPGLEIVSAVLPQVHSLGRTSSAEKRCNRDG